MLKTIAKLFSELMNKFGKKAIVSYITKAFGVAAGGFWSWIITKLVEYGWKKAEPEITSAAKDQDRKISDNQVVKEYQKNIEEKASEETLIKNELDLFNPKRGR